MSLLLSVRTVNVPTRALGLHKDEQVVAAWSEMERMRPALLLSL